jgi:hypothetical protein
MWYYSKILNVRAFWIIIKYVTASDILNVIYYQIITMLETYELVVQGHINSQRDTKQR